MADSAELTDLCLLQWCHSTAEHRGAVLTDLQEEVLVAAGVRLEGVEHQGQRGAIDDEAIVLIGPRPTPSKTQTHTQ